MEIKSADFEKLGVFYLGKTLDLDAPDAAGNLLLYDSKDLTTHAVVVGMTGSGKTGLCLGLLEEAGMDNIPAIVIDPKGDIANLMLTFPGLSTEEFEPWVDPGQAQRDGLTTPEFAALESAKWQKGLAKWGQDGERIRTLRERVEMRVYTPGSSTGRPLTILKSFAAPCQQVLDDADAFRERISSAASGILALLGIDVDPIRSREHILVSQILQAAWQKQQDLNLESLIEQIQAPPFLRVGAFDLEKFFPEKDRMVLAMTMNNLLASPSFSSWMEGDALDIKELLHNKAGQPCISIMSIAHLNDAERMFFVTILLNEVLTWMRTQAGTSSLRAILYMDEVFGYFPPSKNPPSKQPMLTLLKQARAFGLGVVLATQNPVDLDYKGLSNTGTWFLGRLQTERDKMRVIEGLEGAAAQNGGNFNRSAMEKILAGLGARKFLMNNVHDDEPVIFETRWCMSYLRGPLTRQQIQKLMPRPAEPAAPPQSGPTSDSPPSTEVFTAENAAAASLAAVSPSTAASGTAAPSRARTVDPARTATPATSTTAGDADVIDPLATVPKNISQKYLEPDRRPPAECRVEYRPGLLGHAKIRFARAALDVDHWEDRWFLLPVDSEELPAAAWEGAMVLGATPELSDEPYPEASWTPLPTLLHSARGFKDTERDFKDFIYRNQSLELWECVLLKERSQPQEDLRDFKIRLETKISEERDRETEKLRKQFAARYQDLRSKIDRAGDAVDRERSQYQTKRMESFLNVGSTLMGALLGRRTARKTSTTVKSWGQASEQHTDLKVAQGKLSDLENQYKDLDLEFNQAMASVGDKFHLDQLKFEKIAVPPRKTDIQIESLILCWLPWFVAEDQAPRAAF